RNRAATAAAGRAKGFMGLRPRARGKQYNGGVAPTWESAMARSDRPLTDEERGEVTACVAYARELLALGPDAGAEEAQAKIGEAVARFRSAPADFPGLSDQDLALCLGSYWGQTVCDDCGWSWSLVTLDDGDEVYGVVPADRAHVIFPLAYVH